jgi:hypothetical protein
VDQLELVTVASVRQLIIERRLVAVHRTEGKRCERMRESRPVPDPMSSADRGCPEPNH